MKFIKEAKETWTGLKNQQRLLIFEAVWFGKLIPGIPLSEKGKVQTLMDSIKKRVGKFPGLMYAEIYKTIENYKLGLVTKQELQTQLYKFYPIESTLTLKINKTDSEFNKQTRFKILTLGKQELEEILTDLKASEERDKIKIMATI